MKQLIYLILISVLITSCQVTEEVTLNKNGSGIYNIGIDMSPMMGMMKDEKKNDSLQAGKKKKNTDTIISLYKSYEMHKDSIQLSPEEKHSLEKLKELTMHLKVNEEAGVMFLKFNYPFKKLSDLENFFKDLAVVEKIDKKAHMTQDRVKSDMLFGMNSGNQVKYKMTRRYFKRIVTGKKNKATDSTTTQQKQEAEKFFKMITYRLVYHFPKKIKEVKFDGEYKFADEGKTLVIEIPLDEMEKHPEKSSFEVRFK